MIIKTPDELETAEKVLRSASRIAVDTETTGLKQPDRPFSLITATKEHQFYFDNRVIEDRHIREIVKTIQGATLVFQNAKFDIRMVENQWGSLNYTAFRDTEILGRLVCNHHLSYSLAAQAKRYGMEKSEEVVKYIKEHKLTTKRKLTWSEGTEELQHYDRVPIHIISDYALKDARITYDLYEKMRPELDEKSVPVWMNECALIDVCYKMERRGLLVNEEYTKEALEYERRLVREAMHQFLLVTGHVYDNSKNTLVEVFRKAGEKIPQTEKGNDSLTDDVLESFTSPAAKIVQRIRFFEKRISTYYTNFLELAEKGVIHPDMRMAGTTTGRFSYREPNLQNLPKEDDEENQERFSVRGCFKPRPGYVFVSMDYSQQEYRLMLAYANHWRLIEQVMGGMDVHQATADMVGITRKQAKTLNFAILYGAGVEKLAAMLGVSTLEASQLKARYFARLREVQILIKNVVLKGQSRGFVYNWLGRKLGVNHRDFAYKLPNYLIQGGGADICKVAMNRCDFFLKDYDAHMVLQVHDAIYFEMREADMKHLIPELRRIMIDAFPEKQGMKMNVDVSWSKTSLAERDMAKWE